MRGLVSTIGGMLILAALSTFSQAQEEAVLSPLEAAAAAQSQAFLAAFNSHAVDDVLALFHDDAVLVDEAGKKHQGKPALRQLLEAFFEQFPEVSIQLDEEELTLVGDDMLIKEGRRILTTQDGNSAVIRFESTLKRQGDSWLIVTLREQPGEDDMEPGYRLEPLAWLVGDWVNEGSDADVAISARWSDDGNFVLIDYQVLQQGEVMLRSHQRLGWDPQAKKIRHWLFDSDGGYGSGFWTWVDDRWLVKSTAVLPDGTSGSATFVYEPSGSDAFTFYALDRVIGDDVGEDLVVKIVRRPPSANP